MSCPSRPRFVPALCAAAILALSPAVRAEEPLPADRQGPATAASAPSSLPCATPGALGTARDLEIGGSVRVGLKTYPQSLALADHEVVLTFDDGPWPATTPRILDTLSQNCVRATFFLIGRNAAAAPALVRREIEEGHSVGHHSWSHPAVTLRAFTETAALADIDHGMAADDKAAYGSWSGSPRVPFFRFPGFADSPALLEDLAARHIAVFGTDLWASDWVPMTPEAELDRVMSRLEAAGRGIILLHDTKEQTAAMLPQLMRALQAGGYHVVHLVPGAAQTPTRPAAAGWSSETERVIEHLWPKLQASAAKTSDAALKGTIP